MREPAPATTRKDQIVTAAIERLSAVGFEGFRVADVARDVGINNATLIHHFPSKVALINAVVERFTQRFQSVANTIDNRGSPRAKLARHMRSSVALMRTDPGMFAVLNEIMIRARRDPDIASLVAVPLAAWRQHIIGLMSPPSAGAAAAKPDAAEDIATACMAQLLGMGLLLNATGRAEAPLDPRRDRAHCRAIDALASLVAE